MNLITYIFIGAFLFTTSVLVREEQDHDLTKSKLDEIQAELELTKRRLVANEIACE